MICPTINKIRNFLYGPAKSRKHKRAQVVVLYALSFPVIFMTAGLGIDTGIYYGTVSKLSRSMDSTAFRVTRKFEEDQTTRQNMIMQMMRSNFTGFMENPGSWTTSGSISAAGGEVMTITDGIYTLVVTTSADSNTDTISTNIKVTGEHRTFFMPIGGIPVLPLSNETEVERVPSVNALVIDVSGSMIDNNGCVGVTTGIPVFVNEFAEGRDYMLLVCYSSKASVVWPDKPVIVDKTTYLESGTALDDGSLYAYSSAVGPITGLPYYPPSRGFISGIDLSSSRTLINRVTNYIGFDGNTAGGEGLRLAAEQVQKFLDNQVSSSVKDKLQVNYIFMTDGEFNICRTYVRGRGFGKDLNNVAVDTSPTLSVHNTFHDYMPVVLPAGDTSFDFEGTTYSVSSLFGTYGNAKDMPGVNCMYYLNGVTINAGDNDSSGIDTNSYWFAMRSDTTSTNVMQDFNNRLLGIPNATIASFSNASLLGADPSVTPHPDYGDAFSVTSPAMTLPTHAQFFGEKLKMDNCHELVMPQQISDDIMNPYLSRTPGSSNTITGGPTGSYLNHLGATVTASGTYTSNYFAKLTRNGKDYFPLSNDIYEAYSAIWDAQGYNTATQNVRLTNDRLSYFPKGATFINHAGTYFQRFGTTSINSSYMPTSSKLPHLVPNGDSYSDLTGHVTVRLADFYPTYTIFGDANVQGSMSAAILADRGAPSLPSSPYGDSEVDWINRPDDNGSARWESSSPAGYMQRSPWDLGTYATTNDNTNLISIDERTYITSNTSRVKPTEYWNFFSTSADKWETPSTSLMTALNYKLARAQAWQCRVKQNATIYTIIYGDNNGGNQGVGSMRAIANDPTYAGQTLSGIPLYQPGQKEGIYYKVTEGNSDELVDVFKEIAARVGMRLTK